MAAVEVEQQQYFFIYMNVRHLLCELNQIDHTGRSR